MDKKMRTRLFVLLVILFGGLGIFILYNSWPNLFGNKIILNTEPFDPFDPLRGQYMQIRYEIGTLDGKGFSEKDNVCVLLEEDSGGIWRPGRVSDKKFDEGVFICGLVNSVYPDSIRVEYDIEKFYFEKGANVPTENITVEVAVSSGGRARIIQLLQNGEPVDIEYNPLSWKS